MPKAAPRKKAGFISSGKAVRMGFIPLADSAPLLAARELGLFERHGVAVQLSCEVGWATIREKLLYGQLDAAHAIAGLALAMRLGLSMPPARVVAPLVLNLQGNAITLSRDLWNRGVRDAATLRKLIRSSTSRRFTFGIVSRFSSHHFLLRRWLGGGGIDAERDVRLVTLPPTQMPFHLEKGLIDGFCAGEPWNSVAVERGAGWISATSAHLAPLHPEKVLLMGETFIDQQREQAAAAAAAIRDACAFCQEPENHPEVMRILQASGHFTSCETALARSLIGPFDYGTGHTCDAADFHIFHGGDANEPTPERGRWLLNEFINHGLITPDRRAEAGAALRACWSSTFLPSQEQSAAAKANTTSLTKRPQTSVST